MFEQALGEFVSVEIMLTRALLPLQRYLAVGGSKLQAVPHWTDFEATHPMKIGGLGSITVTY
jgi:hypothetical protein